MADDNNDNNNENNETICNKIMTDNSIQYEK
jgi:hypothetical protein